MVTDRHGLKRPVPVKTIGAKGMSIMQLQPGQSIKLSECNGVSCYVERSGNGKHLTYYRQTASGFEVFRKVAFQGDREWRNN